MKRLLIGTLCILWMLVHHHTQGQDINWEDPRLRAVVDSLATLKAKELTKPKPPKPMPVYMYRLQLTGDLINGNVNRVLYNVRPFFNYEDTAKVFGFFSQPRYAYGEVNKNMAENELFVDANSTLFYHKKRTKGFYLLGFGAFESSNLRRISERWLGGAGLGWHIVRRNQRKDHVAVKELTLTNAILYEKTDFQATEDIETWRNSTRLRLSLGLLKDKLILSNTTFLKPSITSDNFRWNAISTLEAPLTAKVSLTSMLENNYESIIAQGVQNTDLRWTFGVTIRNF